MTPAGRARIHRWPVVGAGLALDLGFDTFVLMGQPDPQMLRTFIEDVAPRVASASRRRVQSLELLDRAAPLR